MSDADREKMLRDMAANRGCKLVKSRRRTPGVGDYGRYGLKDAVSGREVFGFGSDGLIAAAEEIEAFLRKGAISDWKSSLAAAAGAANDERTPAARTPARKSRARAPSPPPPKLRVVEKAEQRTAPPPPPPPAPPAPPPLQIRDAKPADATAIAALLGAAAAAIGSRIAALRRAGTPPLVAVQGKEIVGCCAFQALPLLQEEAPLGRLTLLLVSERMRRRGIGRALVEEASARLADLGCARIEALAEIELAAAPDFFRRLSWTRSAYRYARDIGD